MLLATLEIIFLLIFSSELRTVAANDNWTEEGVGWSESIDGGREIRATESQDKRFRSMNNTVVTAQVASTAVLHCQTTSTTGGLVSWIRKRDYQLLTVGLKTHSRDDRFSINYVHWDWQLHVRYVQPRDAGIYECQVSSHPPTSIFLHLDVVEAEAEIFGAPEKHVKAGSILRLVCILHYTTESPAYVFWYRDQQMINYNEEQSVVVESDKHTSVLLVTKAERHHSGNYTCSPSNAKPASILVHILNGELGEHPAAMQHGESTARSRPPHALLLPSCILLLLLWTLVSTHNEGSHRPIQLTLKSQKYPSTNNTNGFKSEFVAHEEFSEDIISFKTVCSKTLPTAPVSVSSSTNMNSFGGKNKAPSRSNNHGNSIGSIKTFGRLNDKVVDYCGNFQELYSR